MANTRANRGHLDSLRVGVIAVFLTMIIALSAPKKGFAQCTLSSPASWNVTSGNWSVAGNWTPASVPNSSTTNVCLTNGTSGTPATTTLDITAAVADLQLGAFNTLAMGGSTLTVHGASIANAGSITSNDGNLTLASNVTLSGGGAITTSSDTFINQATTGLTLTNVDNTIKGTGQYGQNGLAIVNQSGGVITASGGTLTLNGGGAVTNTGLLDAVTGGTLQINNTVNNAGGSITANGGTVTANSTINGGTLNQINGGTLTSSTATLNGVTISSGSTYNVGGTTFLQGTITNRGTITVPDTTLQVNGGTGVTLTGGGTVLMSNDAFFNQSTSGLTLNNVNNTIEGTGQLGQNGLALNNEAGGTINADVTSGILTLNGSGLVTNQGLLEATNSGTLQINNNVTNTGANITANGGTVNINSTINGGTLNQINGGTLTSTTATLNGVTISTGSTYNVGNVTFLQGTITNQGTITVPGTTLQVNGGNFTLQGGGTVMMSGDGFFNQSTGGLTLNNVNNTIEGTGQLGQNGLPLNNEAGGTVNANVSGGTLTLNGGGSVTNAGLLEASNGGTLQIQNNVTNTSANITANTGSTVLINNSATITGGTLNTVGTGVMNGNGSVFLNGVTISSGSTYNVGATTFLQGTITNHGTITVPNNTLQVNGGTGVTLTGGGTVMMSSDAFFNQSTGGLTLNNVNNTIEGTGPLGQNGLSLNNEAGGTVNANVSGGTLTLNGGGSVTNVGLLEASNGGTLQIQNKVTNTGANITANAGSTVLINNSATITAGTLNTVGTGVMNGNGSVFLNGVTISTGSTYNVGATTFLQGTITNQGTITVPNNFLQVNGGTGITLTGGGTVMMSSDAFFNQSTSGLTLNNVNNTIEGTGQLGQNGLALNNEAGGTVDANVSAGTLSLNGGGTVTNAGTFEAKAGSTLLVSNPINSSTYASGTLLTGAYDANGTIQLNAVGSTGGEIVTNKAHIILNGSAGGAALISDSAGKNALSNLATNEGSFTIESGGNANFTTAGNLANSGTVTVGAGTTLKLGSSGASSYAQSAGLTQGTGTIAGVVAINGGTLQPGAAGAPGTLIANGATSLNGTFAEQIASTSNFSVLNVTGGNLTLGSASTLNISLLGSFDPVGDTFTIMTDSGGTVSGTFSNAPAAGFTMDGVNWTIAYNSNDVVLDGVSMAGSGLVMATWNTPSGNWSTSSEWSCAPGPATCVPNNSSSNTYAAVIDSPGNTLTLSSTSTPSSVTVNTLSLQAGTLDIGSGSMLTLAAQPNGVTDIPQGAGLSIEGEFAAGMNSGVYKLTSVEGSLTVDNGLSGIADTVTPLTGTVTVSSTGVVNISGAGTAVTINGNGVNSGSDTVSAGGSLTTTGNYSQTSGRTTVNNGSLSVGGSLSNDAASKLFIQDGGSVTAAALDNFGNVTTGNASSDTGNNSLTVSGAVTNEASGTLALMANKDSATAGSFNNAGAVSLASGSSLTVNPGGAYTQTAGTTGVNGTLMSAVVNINGGTLSGTGTVAGAVTIGSAATLSPGDAPGTITIKGTLNLSGTLDEAIDSASSFDVTDVSGQATLGSSSVLNIMLDSGFDPGVGASFTIMDFASLTTGSAFGSILNQTFNGGTEDWAVSYNPTNIVLTAQAVSPSSTPEPASLLLLGTGLVVLGLAMRKRNRAQV